MDFYKNKNQSKVSLMELHDDIHESEREFIKNNFNTRSCIKDVENKDDICESGLHGQYHSNGEQCVDYGRLHFSGCDDLCKDHRFIRFNVIDETSVGNKVPLSTVGPVFTLINDYWNVPKPTFVISVIGGFKRMNISNQQKKNFKQGLIDVMKKEKTLMIAGGFNVGIHKLVGETVKEFRIHHEKTDNQVYLLGISTWGVVLNNREILSKEFIYSQCVSNEKQKVELDPNCDCFLFCDDGTEKKYDVEVNFRLEFEKYYDNQDSTFVVQILFEGGWRAVLMAHETLKSSIPIVVLKGSGRAADMISEVMELDEFSFKNRIEKILEEYKEPLAVKDDTLALNVLKNMYEECRSQIIIYDMFDNAMKFGERIVEAIISDKNDKQLEEMLNLTILYDCQEIARRKVFADQNYTKIDRDTIKKYFIKTLIHNQFDFVALFLENEIDINHVVDSESLLQLYETSRKLKKSYCAELINDLLKGTRRPKKLFDYGKVISILSGNILQNIYKKERRREPLGAQDLFLWSVLSGRIELAHLFWKYGKCHISSALIGSTILSNMASYILRRGDIELQNKLEESSRQFEKMAFDILTISYNESKDKTNIILIRQLEIWSNTTCFRIAISGNHLEFLSHSACRSYATELWMGGLSPLLSTWKILLTIPFSLCCINFLVLPSFRKNITEKMSENKEVRTPSSPDTSTDVRKISMEIVDNEKPVTFCKIMKIFYRAPIIKFYINFASYLVFLIIFAYLNLVELKPRNEIKDCKDMAAEIFVYVYLVSFILEEIRQISEQKRLSIVNKLKVYFDGSCNKSDVTIIVIFIICIILRFILLGNNFMIIRCLFGICFGMFCMRTMQFYFAYEFIGPKVIMIRNMLRDISFFLSIFILFIISYGTLSHSIRFPNSPLNVYLLRDVVQMPYFQTYGELMLDKLFDESLCNTTSCHFQKGTIIVGFGLYLLMTNILLVNLLIAMFGYTFNKIQDQSSKYWLYVRLQLAEEFYTKPILSPPLNILYCFYYIALLMTRVCKCRNANKPKKSDKNLMMKILLGDENLKITGYEKICMDAFLEDHVTPNNRLEKNNKIYNKQEMDANFHAQTEASSTNENQSYQAKCEKRLERLEKNIEKLLATKN